MRPLLVVRVLVWYVRIKGVVGQVSEEGGFSVLVEAVAWEKTFNSYKSYHIREFL